MPGADLLDSTCLPSYQTVIWPMDLFTDFKGANLNADAVSRNAAINALRAPAERANALLEATWPVLRRITLDPWRITEIAAAALVLLHLQRPITE